MELYKKQNKFFQLLLTMLAATVLFVLYTILLYPHLILQKALLWNIFLAASSVPFALLLWKSKSGKQKLPSYIITGLIALVWLFLFPNGPYMVTDLIHISLFSFPFGKVELPDISPWLGMFHIAFSVLLGCMWGNVSLYIVHRFVAQKKGEAWGWAFVMGISLLTGAGIYIGRFMRFNSWDILHRPIILLKHTLNTAGGVSLRFTLLFTAVVFCLYGLFYICFHCKTAKKF